MINTNIINAMGKLDDIRRENARQLVKDTGGPANFARRVGMTDSRVSQLLGKKFSRNIGNIAALQIEQAFQLPDGWLSAEHSEDSSYDQTSNTETLKIKEAAEPSYSEISLAYVTQEELRLLMAFREANEIGKEMFRSAMKTAPKDSNRLQFITKP